MNQILQCCSNHPSFLINYKIGSRYFVCDSCIKLDSWSNGITEKIPITEVNGLVRQKLTSVQESDSNDK